MIDILFHGVGWTDIARTLNRIAVGMFFMLSGYHKLFNPERHRVFADELKELGVHRAGGWWFHLRRCAECGHIGCCDSSPSQHASKHYAATGHPIITSFEPGERWFYDFRTEESFAGPKLAAPHAHPLDQPAPGPAERVPANWQTLLHE
jgi:hypothetical protein